MDIVAHCWILNQDTCGHCGQEVSAGKEEKAISEWKQERLIMSSQKQIQYYISNAILHIQANWPPPDQAKGSIHFKSPSES